MSRILLAVPVGTLGVIAAVLIRTAPFVAYDQQNQLPAIKAERPEFRPLGSHALQETLRRVDRAFTAFFRRVKTGQTPGYPRFKSWRRFSGWTWPDQAGWQFRPGAEGKHGRLLVGHLGAIKVRGQARTPGTPVSCTLSYRQGYWYASFHRRVITATSVVGEGREGLSDEEQLRFATSHHLVLVTANVGDYIELARQWAASVKDHAGMVFVMTKRFPRRDAAAITQALHTFVRRETPEQMGNSARFLAKSGGASHSDD